MASSCAGCSRSGWTRASPTTQPERATLRARQRVDAPDPALEPRKAPVQEQVIAQDLVEAIGVTVLPEQGVLEEREGGDVGERELAPEEVAPVQETIEEDRK